MADTGAAVKVGLDGRDKSGRAGRDDLIGGAEDSRVMSGGGAVIREKRSAGRAGNPDIQGSCGEVVASVRAVRESD